MTKKSWAFSDLVAAISAALHEKFVCSKYANSVSQFLLYWMRIICCIYKDFVRQLKAFRPSFCHFCACEMSSGWGHLITWMDPSVGHLNVILARVGGNLNNNFEKRQMPRELPGGDVEASIWPIHDNLICCKTGLMWVVKRATSLFNSFCSNVAKQVTHFLLPVLPYFKPLIRQTKLQSRAGHTL